MTGWQLFLQACGLWRGYFDISLKVAIIADDLTGALDVSAPFARRGLQVEVAVSPEGLPAALARGAEIVCVNTASRELSASEAAESLEQAASLLAGANPAIVFNKIDSRLKGHVALGIDICRRAFHRRHALLAPAIPAQNRFVRDGLVNGDGVATPIDISERLAGLDRVNVADSDTDLELEALARGLDGDTLLVGASGLGSGLARVLAKKPLDSFLPAPLPLLLAIGSHDPVTLAQIALLGGLPDVCIRETADGMLEGLDHRAITLAHALSDPETPGHRHNLARFGASVARLLQDDRFASALLCGGETAQSVLKDLGVETLRLRGEAASGIPLCEARVSGRLLTILTKSGGFGTPDELFRLAENAVVPRQAAT